MSKFWSMEAKSDERTDLYLLDEIAAEESWFSDGVTPKAFKRELDRARGTLYVWLDSPGGDAFAGAAIHDMLREYSASGRGRVIAMVSLAASAASVIAMAADEIRISVVGTIMIHEPWSRPTGKASELRAVADVLEKVRDAQVDAYARRTGQTREAILELLEGPDGNGTYMNAQQAIELGFADGMMHEEGDDETQTRHALARTRIASSLKREEARLAGIAAKEEPWVPMTEEELCVPATDWTAILNDIAARLDGIKPGVMEAAMCGVRAGLAYWDELMKGTPSDVAEGTATDDTGLAALMSAIRAVGTEDDPEEPDDDTEGENGYDD